MTVPCRGKLSRRALVIGLALAMGTGAAHAAGALKVWRHGIVEAKGDSSILFMPARGGFAEKRGIDLQLVQFVVGTTPVRALVAGQLESFEGSPVVALAAMHQGADIKIVGCHWPVMTYSVFARADINSISDLRGKTVGVSAPGSLPDLFIREALESGGLKDTDVRYANAGSSTDRFKAVAAGVVDAAGSSSEFEIEAGARGLTVLMRGAEATPNLLRSCLMTTARNIAGRRADLVNFLAASMEGYAHALANREAAVRLAKESAHLPPGDGSAEFVYDEVIKYSAVTPDLAIPLDKVQWADDIMVKHGAVRERMDAARFVDDGPRREALRLIGN